MAILQSTTSQGDVTASSYAFYANSFKYLRSFNTAGTYNWAQIFKDYWVSNGYFVTAGIYSFWIVSNNGAHYYGYTGILAAGYLVPPNGYGANFGNIGLDWAVSDITNASSAWLGGCGSSPFSSIDNSGFTYQLNACAEALNLYIKRLD
jgi:hypothetical protein